eukprot:384622-Rhodomonas_salina.2
MDSAEERVAGFGAVRLCDGARGQRLQGDVGAGREPVLVGPGGDAPRGVHQPLLLRRKPLPDLGAAPVLQGLQHLPQDAVGPLASQSERAQSRRAAEADLHALRAQLGPDRPRAGRAGAHDHQFDAGPRAGVGLPADLNRRSDGGRVRGCARSGP